MGVVVGTLFNRFRFFFFLVLVLLVCGCSKPNIPFTSGDLSHSESAPKLDMLSADFAEPFVPTTAGASKKALSKVLREFEADPRPKGEKVDLLESFLAANPDSPWAPSVKLNLGLYYQKSGRFTQALANLQSAWEELEPFQEKRLKALADQALGKYTLILSQLGRMEDLEPLLAKVEGRSMSGSSTESLVASLEALKVMQEQPEIAFLCGPAAMRHVAMLDDSWSPASRAIIKSLPSTHQGTSIHQVQKLSERLGLEYQVAYREAGSEIIAPAVVHWKVGHFAALLEPEDGLYRVEDDTAGFNRERIKISSQTLDTEASGYFLVPSGKLPVGWRTVSEKEAQTIWGRGYVGYFVDLLATGLSELLVKDDQDDCPMTVWDVQASLVSLTLKDTPVGLSPAAFAVPFQVVYSQREAGQPSVFDFSNLGPKWTSNWTSHITDTRITNNKVSLYKMGGGTDEYEFASGATVSNRGRYSDAFITDTGSGFSIEYKDGSTAVYSELIGSRYHLTSTTSPQGNTTTLTYDASGRLTTIVDPVGRPMTLEYDLPADPLKITSATDPFGRSATFTYNAAGQLESVTDVLGIVSSYEYGDNDFVNQLTTPYGTTTFTSRDITTDPSLAESRVIEVVDTEGRKCRVQSAPFVTAGSEPEAPVGMPDTNQFLNFRNTFYWEPQQLDANPVFTKATIFHFLHVQNPTNRARSRVLESMKKPLENRVFYSYSPDPGAIVPHIFLGDSDNPLFMGRVLADGTTQLTAYQYNSKGNITQMTDPAGRVFNYTYAANEIDLTSVSTNGQTLFSATYDANHNILSITDASGSTSSFTYDARGLLKTALNPLGELTTNNYTPSGNLASVESPLQAITNFTYDSAERVSSVTDTEGFTVQATYDSADRPTSVTYPDGTTDTLTYSNLDLIATKDRIGRQTQMTYDGLQRLRTVTDANGGVTALGYGLEDAANSLTDPNGNVTNFTFDQQQRLSSKIYPGGAAQTIEYEPCCGRVSKVTDALGQSKTYTYFLDNQIKNIDYSGTTPDVTFTNDSFLPRPLTMVDGQGTTTMTYGPVGSLGANKLASVSGPYGDQASFNYDGAGRMFNQTINGSQESVLYDQLWRPTSVTNALDTFQMAYLGKTGQVTGVSSAQGPTSQYTYAANIGDRRLLQIKNLRNNGDALSQFDYTYDPVGQITQLVNTFGNGNSSNSTLVASKDSTLRAQKPHRNEGANPIMMLSHRLDVKDKSNNPIVGFDLNNVDLSTVVSAKLVLNIKECEIPKRWGKDGRDIIAQAVTETWVEGNGKRLRVPQGERTRGDGEGVTWFSPIDENISNKKANSAVEWSGARSSLAPVTAAAVTVTNQQTGFIEFNVTADLQFGHQNGWLIRKQDEGAFGNIRFASKEGADAAGKPELAPRLILEFGPPGSASNALAGEIMEVFENVWNWDTSNWSEGETQASSQSTPSASSTETYNFNYDNLSQLIGVSLNNTPVASYQFDLAGNLVSLTTNGTTNNFTYNSLNQPSPSTEIFDAKGQTTSQDGRTIEWDEQGRVTAIVQGTQRSEFEYDGMSHRTAIQELENGVVVSRKLYWWLGGNIVCERDGLQPGFPITKRYFGQGVEVNGEKLYYTLDHLGSVRELLNEAGEVVANYRYTIYGERTKVSGDQDSDFGFAGLFHHEPSGLDLATYRLYDAKLQRFISRDPLGESVDYNLYRYANNNPVMFTDPEGLKPIFFEPNPLPIPDKFAFKNFLGFRKEVCNKAVYLPCILVCIGKAPTACGVYLKGEQAFCQALCVQAELKCLKGTYPTRVRLNPPTI